MIGEVIGKYKLIRLIGEGGMAKVYEGEHELLGTKVAVKILNPLLSANTQIRERFINEAKMMASLNHPNITRVVDFDDQPNRLSILMEYLEGKDLSDTIKSKGPMKEKELESIFQQTLVAFDYAHSKGIVHRDIKPSNIFLLPNGEVKILDFGIAKLFGQGLEMTQTGTQVGTPIYMSPEQVKADKSIDHRSDIYSLGVTLYFALIGKTPYDVTVLSQFDVFNKIVYEPLPDLSDKGKLGKIIDKACQKDRELRFQSCVEWLDELKKPPKNQSDVEERVVDSEPFQSPIIVSELPVKKKFTLKKFLVVVLIIFLSWIYLQLQEDMTDKKVSTVTNDGPETFDAPPEEVRKVQVVEKPEEIEAFVDEEAVFPGGMAACYAFIGKNINYPQIAIEENLQGKCYVNFVIDRSGHISDVRVAKKVPGCPECDAEAVRVIKMMPKWAPGKKNGKDVKSRFMVPVNYKLE